MNELQAIKKLGIAKSPEVMEMVGEKTIASTIKQLQNLEKIKEVEILNFHRGKLYVRPEIFNNSSIT